MDESLRQVIVLMASNMVILYAFCISLLLAFTNAIPGQTLSSLESSAESNQQPPLNPPYTLSYEENISLGLARIREFDPQTRYISIRFDVLPLGQMKPFDPPRQPHQIVVSTHLTYSVQTEDGFSVAKYLRSSRWGDWSREPFSPTQYILGGNGRPPLVHEKRSVDWDKLKSKINIEATIKALASPLRKVTLVTDIDIWPGLPDDVIWRGPLETDVYVKFQVQSDPTSLKERVHGEVAIDQAPQPDEHIALQQIFCGVYTKTVWSFYSSDKIQHGRLVGPFHAFTLGESEPFDRSVLFPLS